MSSFHYIIKIYYLDNFEIKLYSIYYYYLIKFVVCTIVVVFTLVFGKYKGNLRFPSPSKSVNCNPMLSVVIRFESLRNLFQYFISYGSRGTLSSKPQNAFRTIQTERILSARSLNIVALGGTTDLVDKLSAIRDISHDLVICVILSTLSYGISFLSALLSRK